MPDERTACRKKQEALLEAFLSEGENASLSVDLNGHLEFCASCRQYWKGLEGVRSGFPQTSLYSPFLRAKTLRRLADREQAPGAQYLPLIILAALLSVSLSFVLPCWLLSKLFMHWTSSMVAACGAACGALFLLGLLVTMATAISLVERGYIRMGNGEGIKSYVRFPPTIGRSGFPSL